MITLLHTTTLISLILLPLIARKKSKTIVLKNEHDTSGARYAVNANGFLEEISGSKITDRF